MKRPLFRKRRKINWYRLLLIVAAGHAAVYVAIKLGESDVGWLFGP